MDSLVNDSEHDNVILCMSDKNTITSDHNVSTEALIDSGINAWEDKSPSLLFVDSGSQSQRPTQLMNGANLKDKFEIICRFCLIECETCVNLFEIENVCGIIAAITAIQVAPDDMYPKQICAMCFGLLKTCVDFKRQIESAEKTLRKCGDPATSTCSINSNANKHQLTVDEAGHAHNSKADQDLCSPGENFDKFIEEDYDTEYVMVYEADPNLYSDCDMEDESALTQTCSQQGSEQEHEGVEPNQDQLESKTANKSGKIKCEICERVFIGRKQLNKHLKVHDTNKASYVCPICRKSFPHLANLECHQASHKNEISDPIDDLNSFKCNKCNASFTVERDLYIHGSVHPVSDEYKCRECLKRFPDLTKLKRHVKIHFQDKPVKCEQCGRGFPEMASLTRHYRIHTNEPRDRKHVCKDCGKSYYDSHSLSIHVRKHTGEKPWVCTKCDKRFIDSRLLNSHMRTHLNIRQHVCNVCDKKFTHRSTLISHMRTHTGEKPFACTICGKSFIQSSNLMLHLRVHSGEKPYQCSKCSKAFGSSSTLALHVRTHTGEKPYSCNLCGKKFARHNLTIHMRTHTGEKPYECLECSRKFTTSGQLVYHKRTHTGQKPFTCEICNKKCATPTNLKKHMQTHLHLTEPIVNAKNESTGTSVMEKTDPYSEQKHRIRIEEMQSEAEFNENTMLVNDLLASVVNVNAEVLQSGNVEIPELSTYDSHQDIGELRNMVNRGGFKVHDSKGEEIEADGIFVTDA